MRHADAGYEIAKRCAQQQKRHVSMLNAELAKLK